MPPDINSCVRKFVPNNAKLAEVCIRVLRQTYQVQTLPIPLVKAVVERALEQSRTMEMKVESAVFEEKLSQYCNQLRPRFLRQINELRRRGKKW